MIALAAVVIVSPRPLQAQQPSELIAKLYDVPAQSLDGALDRYVRISGTQVLYEAVTTAGRRSTPLKGRFTPEAALATLLGGTGLVAKRADINAFVVARASAEGLDDTSQPRPDMQFLAALQRGVLAALCRNPRTRPGDYKVAIELWISPAGAVERSSLIGSTGHLARDQTLVAILSAANIGTAPPPNVPQPFILTIAQRPRHQTGDCGG